MKEVAYPEHEKMKAVQKESQAIGSFLDQLSEDGVFLAKYDEEDIESSEIRPLRYNINDLLAKFFNIDLDKIEAEKVAMIKECQKLNK